MQTWIVSLILLIGVESLGADFATAGVQMDLNPPVKIAAMSFRPLTAEQTKAEAFESEMRCRDFRFVSGLCEKVRNFLIRNQSK